MFLPVIAGAFFGSSLDLHQYCWWLRLGLSQVLHGNPHRNPIQQDEPLTQLPWLVSQLVEWTLSVVPTGAGPVDPQPVANFQLGFIQILHHHTRKSVLPAR
jgi:hypothetical protein